MNYYKITDPFGVDHAVKSKECLFSAKQIQKKCHYPAQRMEKISFWKYIILKIKG